MSSPFDPEQVRALAGILVQSGLTEIEVEAKELRIRLVRALAPWQRRRWRWRRRRWRRVPRRRWRRSRWRRRTTRIIRGRC